MKKFLQRGFFIMLLAIISLQINTSQAQVANDADGMFDSTSYVETNSNTTSNSNVTSNNTNVNDTTINSTNTNTNNTTVDSTSTNTNVNTNNTTVNSTSTNTNVNTNNNTNNSTSTSTNTNVNTSTIDQNVTSNTTSNVTSNNTNTNVNTSTIDQTTNSTINQNTNSNIDQNVNQTTNSTIDQTITQNTTSNITSNNTNTNTNTNNTTINSTAANTNNNNNVNTSDVTQRIESPPPSAIAPTIMSGGNDTCTVTFSGAVQTQVIGLSGGGHIRDMNCERLKNAKTLYNMGMKVAAVALMCQDPGVFDAMRMAGTPCPFMGEIGNSASELWEQNPDLMPEGTENVVLAGESNETTSDPMRRLPLHLTR